MKIFLAGASGVIGRNLIPKLVSAGHEVVGTTRSAENKGLIAGLGASPIVMDVFDLPGLIKAVAEIRPDCIIHQLTDLSNRDFAANNRIRTIGTRNLVRAAQEVDITNLIAQSIAWAYIAGDIPADENVPLDTEAAEPRRTTVEGVVALEKAVGELERGLVLRYGLLYGPGTWYAPDGMVAEQVRQGKLTADKSVTSFLHVEDAASATLQALNWPPGIFNIVDDEPAQGVEWLPIYASSLNAPPPPLSKEKLPTARGATNNKARQHLNWQPRYHSWRQGFYHQGN